MKYKISTIILSIVLIIIVAFSTVNAYASNNVRVGDANGDGDINLLDVVCLAQYVAGWDVELGGNSSATSSMITSKPSMNTSSSVDVPSVEPEVSIPSVSSSVSSVEEENSSHSNTNTPDVSSSHSTVSNPSNNASSSYSTSSQDGWTGDYIIK